VDRKQIRRGLFCEQGGSLKDLGTTRNERALVGYYGCE